MLIMEEAINTFHNAHELEPLEEEKESYSNSSSDGKKNMIDDTDKNSHKNNNSDDENNALLSNTSQQQQEEEDDTSLNISAVLSREENRTINHPTTPTSTKKKRSKWLRKVGDTATYSFDVGLPYRGYVVHAID